MRTATVTLTTALTRNSKELTDLEIREPSSGECRGLKLADIMNMDVTTLHVLLPRITHPPLTKAEAEALTLHDITLCGAEILGFFEKPATLLA